jgi:hypothetical protein
LIFFNGTWAIDDFDFIFGASATFGAPPEAIAASAAENPSSPSGLAFGASSVVGCGV